MKYILPFLLFLVLAQSCSSDSPRYHYICQDYNGTVVGYVTDEKHRPGDSIQITNNQNHKVMVLGTVYGSAAIDTILFKLRN